MMGLVGDPEIQAMDHLRIGGRIGVCIDGNKIIGTRMIWNNSGDVEKLLTVARIERFLQRSDDGKLVLGGFIGCRA